MDPKQDDKPESRDQLRSRLENEIQEILERTDRPPSNVVRFTTKVKRDRNLASRRFTAYRFGGIVTDLNILIAAMVLAVLGFAASDSSSALARLLAVLSVAALVWLFVRYFRRPGHGPVKTWRGRDIDLSPPRRSDWLEKRFGGPRRKR